MSLLSYFGVSPDKPMLTDEQEIKQKYNRLRWSVFLSATLGYGMYYVCRLSLNVIKKPIVDAGVLSETELGIIGSALFVTYAVGKFANGFLADRSNIRRFLSVGIFISALINLFLGFTTSFYVFVALWAINGWMQSMGAAPCVVGLSRWFSEKERGTFYGLWSSSHNIGEALTFIFTAWIVSFAGWQWGFKGAGLIGLIGFFIFAFFMRDTPGSYGLPPIAQYKGDIPKTAHVSMDKAAIAKAQRDTLRNPAIWMLALSAAFMYISRYAVNSWGIFYLEADKGYTNIEASSIVSISSVCGIIGTMSCGWISDKFFNGRRNLPALIFGIMNVIGLVLFLASVGIKAGAGFWETVAQGDGLLFVLTGFLITILPILIIGTVARLRYRFNYFTIMGMLAGTYTDPPALAYANSVCSKEAPAVGYSTVYPLSMFLRILTAQIIVLFFCGA